jgi:prolyl-tRNA synthetase
MGIDPGKCRMLVDHSIATSSNLVCGANEEHYHFRNFNLDRDLPDTTTVSLAQAGEGHGCPACGAGRLQLKRGIEVGNIFQLGAKYTESMGMTYADEEGRPQHPLMGCYGIGVGRLLSSVIEARHDEYGPKWPMSVAPWHVCVIALQVHKPDIREAAEKLHSHLLDENIEVLYDDRELPAGPKFAEADLLGVPLRLTVSQRNLAKGQIEWKRRDTGDRGTVPAEQVMQFARDVVASADGQES